MAVRVDNDGVGGTPRRFALHLGSAGPRSDQEADEDSAAARLEVVRQGEWLGFRSAAAGGRFLQVMMLDPSSTHAQNPRSSTNDRRGVGLRLCLHKMQIAAKIHVVVMTVSQQGSDRLTSRRGS